MSASNEQLEKRFDDFIKTTNDRLDETANKLDVLIGLTQQIAVIQERQNHNTEELKRLETSISNREIALEGSLKRIEEKMEKNEVDRMNSLTRIHSRIDGLVTQVEERHKVFLIEHGVSAKQIDADMENIKTTFRDHKSDYDAKTNFFRGVFAAIAVFFTISQGVVYKYFNDIETRVNENKINIQKMENRFNETDRQIDLIIQSIKK